jgi:hypothetical protein
MPRLVDETDSAKSHKETSATSKLGKELRRIRERIESSSEKLLTRRELERELAERRRGGNQ